MTSVHRAPVGAALVLVVLVWGCSRKPEPPSPPPANHPAASASVAGAEADALQRGREIVLQAGRALSSVLLEAIRTGGPTNAVPLCSVQAIPLTASLAQANNVQLRRVSHRPRNPVNQANEAELALIERYRSALSGNQPLQPTVLASAGGAVTFYAPIVITTNLCLNCHGIAAETLSPEVVPILSRLYPADQATGFLLGDLRGLWRIDFPPELLKPSQAAP